MGVAGFFIDLAVVDPEQPGRYLLGIECDGASYHSSRSARDRDRLRQQVLEDRGWIIHRIWSTDWFQRPDEQVKATLAAIEQAKLQQTIRNGQSDPHSSSHHRVSEETNIHREELSEENIDTNGSITSTPYCEANFTIQGAGEIHELSASDLGGIVRKIIEVEGPVHQEEIARRTASLWGKNRTGKRIVQAVENALAKAVRERWVRRNGLFYFPTSQEDVPVRNREEVNSTSLRKPEFISPDEFQAALCSVVEIAYRIDREDAVREVARLFGFRSTSTRLREAIQRNIEVLVQKNRLQRQEEKLSPV